MKARNLFKMWYCEKAGHNNIELEKRFRKEYFKQLRGFTKELLMRNNHFSEGELKGQYRASRERERRRGASVANSVNFEDEEWKE